MKEMDWSKGEMELFKLSNIPEGSHVKEMAFSPDGMSFAMTLYLEGGGISIFHNGFFIDEISYENITNLLFLPDGSLFFLFSLDAMWGFHRGEEKREGYDFLWNPLYNEKGTVAIAAKKDGEYLMVVDGEEWTRGYEFATDFGLAKESPDTCAVVQMAQLEERDLSSFKEGAFSLSVNGETWESTFTNVWDPVLHPQGEDAAAVVRIEGERCGLWQNGRLWEENFDAMWRPVFSPVTKEVLVPAKKGRLWYLMGREGPFFDRGFWQVFKVRVSKDGERVAAIVAPDFGKFTVCVNNRLWSRKYCVIEDIVFSPDGGRVAAIVSKEYPPIGLDNFSWVPQRFVVMDEQEMGGPFEQVLYVSFSNEGEHVAYVASHKGDWFMVIDGKTYSRRFSCLWPPVFSADGKRILIRGIEGDRFVRTVELL